jgi:NAD(P)H dehydrogenase (quinone)
MNIFIIFAHPGKKSFTFQVFEQLKKGLTSAGHQIKISDLYQMDFKPNMTKEEYEREGLINDELPISEDVRLEQQKIDWADCIIFVYPVWWSDCPAILKGWFDRVYTLGYAYGYDKNAKPTKQMKTIPYGLVICTAGHPNEFLKEIGIEQSMRNVMLDDRLGKRFDKKEMIILGGTLEMDKVKAKYLEMAYAIGNNPMQYFTDKIIR